MDNFHAISNQIWKSFGMLWWMNWKLEKRWRQTCNIKVRNFIAMKKTFFSVNIWYFHVTRQWTRDWSNWAVNIELFWHNLKKLGPVIDIVALITLLAIGNGEQLFDVECNDIFILRKSSDESSANDFHIKSLYLGTSHLLKSNITLLQYRWLWLELWNHGVSIYWWLDTLFLTGRVLILLVGL